VDDAADDAVDAVATAGRAAAGRASTIRVATTKTRGRVTIGIGSPR
jgi:hypothetical protein